MKSTVPVILLILGTICGCRAPSGGPAGKPPRASDAEVAPTAPGTEEEKAVAVAKHYARAIAAGDMETARSLLHAPTGPHGRLADAVNRQFAAYHRVRVAAARRIGEAQAKRLPMNDAGTFFIDRMVPQFGSNLSRVVWVDDYPRGSAQRELEMVRVDGQWKVSMESFTSGDSAREVLDAVGDTSEYTRELEKVEREINAGRLTTFEEIHRAT